MALAFVVLAGALVGPSLVATPPPLAAELAVGVSAELGPSPHAHQAEPSPDVDEPAPDVDVSAAAKQAFDEGLAAVSSGEFEAAVSSFERAYELRPHPVTLFNLALALERAGRLPEAWGLFDDVIDIVESSAERREVRRHMRAIESEIAIVDVEARPQQRLCIDGLEMPGGDTNDYRLAVEPGRHELLLDEHAFAVDFEPGDRRVLLLDKADELVGSRRKSALMPAMLGTSIGTGGLAFVLGIGAAAAKDDLTQTGLAIGSATSAGLAIAAGVVALLIETRTISETPRERSSDSQACPGSPELERRLDLQIGPTLGRPVEFAATPLPTPLPTSLTANIEFPHPRGIQPPRGEI
ncbi:hypothetical protein ENSA5_54330 [Enhygromyxa salina]|uniref:Tetratricopeptide repeat protein n=1 Tax=Enhygromyxa salina TaxID=215803 RepID=A0A2S9XFE0_9BACT|nr:tetratricopeptide repeat protein [Enhygromyxa salina]PRP91557.1 hypothetical protein ENSA5_54330 [Enhygromyxa salina]